MVNVPEWLQIVTSLCDWYSERHHKNQSIHVWSINQSIDRRSIKWFTYNNSNSDLDQTGSKCNSKLELGLHAYLLSSKFLRRYLAQIPLSCSYDFTLIWLLWFIYNSRWTRYELLKDLRDSWIMSMIK